MENEILIYHSEEGRIRLNLNFHNETIWLSQKDIAGIFDCTSDNVSLHLKNIYSEGELDENLTTEISSVVQLEGSRKVSRKIKLYNLDAIISVG